MIGPQLKAEEVLTYEQLGDSLTKTAGARQVNEDHPIVTTFGAYCETIIKLAELRAAHAEVSNGIVQLNSFHKLASQRLQQEQMVATEREKNVQQEQRRQAFVAYEPQGREVA